MLEEVRRIREEARMLCYGEPRVVPHKWLDDQLMELMGMLGDVEDTQIKRLRMILKRIAVAEEIIDNPKILWKETYQRIFADLDLPALIHGYDNKFTWTNPDGDYEDDVKAFMKAACLWRVKQPTVE